MLASGAQRGLHLQPVLRSFSTGTGAGAVPALTDTTSSSGGWLTKLLGGSQRITVPLSDPLPGVEIPAAAAPPAKAPGTETTTLPNGVTIASEAILVNLYPHPNHHPIEMRCKYSHSFSIVCKSCPCMSLSASNPKYSDSAVSNRGQLRP
jgi:hypothetical protein